MIPCKECLKYPVCINKTQIECLDLYCYIPDYHPEATKRFWSEQIYIYLPKLISVKHKIKYD